MQEERRDVVGYEGYYKVSSMGRVMGLVNQQGQYREKILSPSTSTGYCYINLCRKGTTSAGKVHRIVAQAFLPNPENKRCVNHKNGIKTDNRLENLEWATHTENAFHAISDLGRTTFIKNRTALWVSKKYGKQIFRNLEKLSQPLAQLEQLKNVQAPAIEERQWVPGYERIYRVSNLGNVVRDPYISYGGKRYKGGSISPSVRRRYMAVCLYANGIKKSWSIHRLVATMFIDNPDNLPLVNHIDGDRFNNHVNNLERCDHSHNMQHAFRVLGRKRKPTMEGKFYGEHNTAKKINQYDLKGNFIRQWSSIKEAKDKVCQCNISWACKGKVKQAGGYIRKYA